MKIVETYVNIRVSTFNNDFDLDEIESLLEERGWIVEHLFVEQEEKNYEL